MSEGKPTETDRRAQSPEDPSLVQIEKPSKVAGGIPAILATAKTTWNEMGVARGVRTLLKLNQKTGFDCPGCAWPEPDESAVTIPKLRLTTVTGSAALVWLL